MDISDDGLIEHGYKAFAQKIGKEQHGVVGSIKLFIPKKYQISLLYTEDVETDRKMRSSSVIKEIVLESFCSPR